MFQLKSILFFIAVIHFTQARHMPSFINACKNDDSFNECAKTNANAAFPQLIPGLKSFHFPALNPLKLAEIDVSSGNLQIILTDVNVSGFETATVTNFNADLNNKKWEITMEIKEMKLVCQYNIKGQILVLPIQGKGPGQFIFRNAMFKYTFNYDLEEKDDGKYGKIQDHKVVYESGKIEFHLENLFNGDKKLGDEMNKFLNENSDDVGKEVTPAIEKAVDTVATQIASSLLNMVPFEEVILA